MFRSIGEIIRPPKNKDADGEVAYSYSCGLCDEGGWGSETEVAIHGRRQHRKEIQALVKKRSTKKPFCLTCIAAMPSASSLIRHFKTEHLHSSPTARRVERELFICDVCEQLFFNKRLLELHIHRRHDTGSLNMLFCPICSRKLRPQSIWTHFQLHRLQSVSTCPICLMKCLNRDRLRQHIKKNHQRHFFCYICGYSTVKESHFNAHIDSYKKKPELENFGAVGDYKKYFLVPRSTQCWTNTLVSYGLKGMKIYNKLYICIICREICLNKAQMSSHIWKDHSNNTPTKMANKHVCSCGEVFINRVLLKHHVFKLEGTHLAIDNNVPAKSTDNTSMDTDHTEGVQPTIEVVSIEELDTSGELFQ